MIEKYVWDVAHEAFLKKDLEPTLLISEAHVFTKAELSMLPSRRYTLHSPDSVSYSGNEKVEIIKARFACYSHGENGTKLYEPLQIAPNSDASAQTLDFQLPDEKGGIPYVRHSDKISWAWRLSDDFPLTGWSLGESPKDCQQIALDRCLRDMRKSPRGFAGFVVAAHQPEFQNKMPGLQTQTPQP